MRSKTEIEENYKEMLRWLDGTQVTKIPTRSSFAEAEFELIRSVISNLGDALRLANKPQTTLKWFLFYQALGAKSADIIAEEETQEGIEWRYVQNVFSGKHEDTPIRDIKRMYFIAPVTVAK